jgi:hypothetical protein
MKKIFALPLVIALSIFSSCQKQQTDAERQAEVDREVQRRLDAEHQAQERDQLAQREAEVNAREKALSDQESASAQNRERATPAARTDERPIRTEDQAATASYDTFYTKLEPQGVWRQTATYGYVWQPREAQESRSWRPYTNGHWVYTDAGWTWVSEEPFGWATYHYGRWTRLRNIGWVWVPGNEWAPAWVSWRKSDDYVGWAPLPPEAQFDRTSGIHNWADNYYDIGPDQYCFVPTNELGAQQVERAIVPPERNVTIVNQTINVTNITYNNTTIVNQGPNYDELRSRTRQPIPRLRLERQINFNFENPRPVVRGEVIQVPAPVIARAQPVERPRTVKETITETVVDHGWEAISDRQAAEKVRMKIKSEATPPPNAPPKTFVKPMEAGASASPSPSLSSPIAAKTPSTSLPAVSATSPAASIQTPAAKAEQATAPPIHQQTPMRFRSPRPLESISPTPTASVARETSASPSSPVISRTPAPRIGATEIPRESPKPNAPTSSPIPLRTPLRSATPPPTASPPVPQASVTVSIAPSVTATVSGSAGSSRFGPSAQSKDLREAARELRKEEKALERQEPKERQTERIPRPRETPANPTVMPHSLGTTSASPSATASPFLNNGLERRKEEKKQQQREHQGPGRPIESGSPSPSMAPQ